VSSDDTARKAVDKVVLAYSGGLDTSIILRWLEETYGCEVVTFTADWARARNWNRPEPRPRPWA